MPTHARNSFPESYCDNESSNESHGSTQENTPSIHASVLARTNSRVEEGPSEPENAPSMNSATQDIGIGLRLEPGVEIDGNNGLIVSSGCAEYDVEINDGGEMRLSCKRRLPEDANENSSLGESSGFAQADNPSFVTHPVQIDDGARADQRNIRLRRSPENQEDDFSVLWNAVIENFRALSSNSRPAAVPLAVPSIPNFSQTCQPSQTAGASSMSPFAGANGGNANAPFAGANAPFAGANAPFAGANGGNSFRLGASLRYSSEYAMTLRERNNLQRYPRFLRSTSATGFLPFASNTLFPRHVSEQNVVFPDPGIRFVPFIQGGNRLGDEGMIFVPAVPAIPHLPAVDDYRRVNADVDVDVDEMSYEELLALEDRIGIVNIGLSEEEIKVNMGLLIYVSPTESHEDDEERCCICQEELADGDELGKLDCIHVFHYDCIKQWLLQKNACPICKMTALSV